MRINKLYVLIGVIALAIASCQKEKSYEIPGNTSGGGGVDTTGNGGNGSGTGDDSSWSSTGSEIGTWKLLYIHAASSITLETSQGGIDSKVVSTADYITEDNTGTMAFDGSTVTTSDISYFVDDTAHATTYIGGTPGPSIDEPIFGGVPSSSATSAYRKISSDSLYLESGALTYVGSDGSTETNGGGCKLRFKDDTMRMTMMVDTTFTEDIGGGVSAKTIEHVTATVTLLKQ